MKKQFILPVIFLLAPCLHIQARSNFRQATGLVPLQLVQFTARAAGADIRLTWKTTMEQNNRGFNVEYSTDDSNWLQVGFVSAAGNCSTVTDYQFIHFHPAAKINSYRLVQVDIDNNKNYSPVQTVVFEQKKISVLFYPNPVTTTLFVQMNASNDRFALQVLDNMGRPIRFNENIAGDRVNTVDVSGLTPGIYLIVIQSLTTRAIVEKFEMQKQ